MHAIYTKNFFHTLATISTWRKMAYYMIRVHMHGPHGYKACEDLYQESKFLEIRGHSKEGNKSDEKATIGS